MCNGCGGGGGGGGSLLLRRPSVPMRILITAVFQERGRERQTRQISMNESLG